MPEFVVHHRDGLYSLDKTAKELCRLIVKFTPVIQRLYPDNAVLLAALEAANAACAALDAAVLDQQQPGT